MSIFAAVLNLLCPFLCPFFLVITYVLYWYCSNLNILSFRTQCHRNIAETKLRRINPIKVLLGRPRFSTVRVSCLVFFVFLCFCFLKGIICTFCAHLPTSPRPYRISSHQQLGALILSSFLTSSMPLVFFNFSKKRTATPSPGHLAHPAPLQRTSACSTSHLVCSHNASLERPQQSWSN